MHPTDDVVSADLLDAAGTARAVAGSAVAYLVARLKYGPVRTVVWEGWGCEASPYPDQ